MDIVINETFDLSMYGGNIFKVGKAELEFTMSIPAPASESGQKLLKLIEEAWKLEITKFVADQKKEFLLALNQAEKGIYARAAQLKGSLKDVKAWLDKEAEGAQRSLNKAVLALKSDVPTKAKLFYTKTAEAFDKKYNTAMRLIQVQAAMTIARDVAIVVGAGSLALIAAAAGAATTVVTGSAGIVSFAVLGPVIIACLSVAVKSTVSIVGSISKNAASHKKSLKDLSSAISDLHDAVEYEGRKAGKTNMGPKESVKLLLTNVKGKRKKVEETKAICSFWRISLLKEVEKLSAELAKAAPGLNDAQGKSAPEDVKKEAAKATATIDKLNYQVKNVEQYLAKVDAALAAAAAILKEAKLEASKLGAVLGKVQDVANDDNVQVLSTMVAPAASAIASVAKLVSKVA